MLRHEVGTLIEVIWAPDQNKYMMSSIIGKVGIILGHAWRGKNWRVLVEGKEYTLHEYDMRCLQHPTSSTVWKDSREHESHGN